MASAVQIVNRALQKIGAARISSFDEGSREANSVKACYEQVKLSELQDNLWTFSIVRATLASDSTAPLFGRTFRYQLPTDYLREAPFDPQVSDLPDDFLFEGRMLLTDTPGPLSLRYVSSMVQEEAFDPLFTEALAARIAIEIVEELTQSASKQEILVSNYSFHIRRAKTANSIQAGPIQPEEDEWVYTRRIGS